MVPEFQVMSDWFADDEPITEATARGYDHAITSESRVKRREWAPGEYRPKGRRDHLHLPKELVEYEPDVGPRKRLEDL